MMTMSMTLIAGLLPLLSIARADTVGGGHLEGAIVASVAASFLFRAASARTEYCFEFESCKDLVYTTDVDGVDDGDKLSAWGYRSATGAQIGDASIVDSYAYDGSKDVDTADCGAGRACESAQSVIAGSVKCNGYRACAEVDVVFFRDRYDVNGFEGLLGSTAYHRQGLSCEGERSCADANIFTRDAFAEGITTPGARALAGSTITCDSANVAGQKGCEYQMEGHYSAYGATVRCPYTSDENQYYKCTIRCSSETACYGLYIEADSDAPLFVYGQGTDPLEPSEYASDEYTKYILSSLSDLDTVPVDPWDSGISAIAESVDAACADMSYDTNVDMQTEIIDADGMVGPVCCRAVQACRTATISSSSDNQPVECLGTQACYESEINALSRVLCTGKYSCRDANINTEQEVYCAGSRACQGAEISAPVVYCSSWTGCTNAKITFSGDFVVFALGQSSVNENTEINCPSGATCTVYCTGNANCGSITTTDNVELVYDLSAPVQDPLATTASPTSNPTAMPTCSQITYNGHYVAAGNPINGQFQSDVAFSCEEATSNQATYESTQYGFDIGVACCDDSRGYREEANCTRPATHQEAVDECAALNLRLCTLQEVLSGKTQGRGCSFDAAYQWTSDECSVDTPASGDPARSIERQQDSGYDVIQSGEQVMNDAAEDSNLMVVLVASLAVVAVMAIAVVLFCVLRKKEVKEVKQEEKKTVDGHVQSSSVELSDTSRPTEPVSV